MMREQIPHIRGKTLEPSARRLQRRPKGTASSPGGGECKPPPLAFRAARVQVKGGFGDRIHLRKVQVRALCTGKRNNNRLTVCWFCSRIRIATGKTSNFKIPK